MLIHISPIVTVATNGRYAMPSKLKITQQLESLSVDMQKFRIITSWETAASWTVVIYAKIKSVSAALHFVRAEVTDNALKTSSRYHHVVWIESTGFFHKSIWMGECFIYRKN